MGFIERELLQVKKELAITDSQDGKYQQLYAVQQALEWALEPNGVKSPYLMVMGIESAEQSREPDKKGGSQN